MVSTKLQLSGEIHWQSLNPYIPYDTHTCLTDSDTESNICIYILV